MHIRKGERVDLLIATLTELKRQLWEEAEVDRSNALIHRSKRKLRHSSAVERAIDELNICEHGGPEAVVIPGGPVEPPEPIAPPPDGGAIGNDPLKPYTRGS